MDGIWPELLLQFGVVTALTMGSTEYLAFGATGQIKRLVALAWACLYSYVAYSLGVISLPVMIHNCEGPCYHQYIILFTLAIGTTAVALGSHAGYKSAKKGRDKWDVKRKLPK